MADAAAMDFLLKILWNVLEERYRLIKGSDAQVKILESELRILRARFKDIWKQNASFTVGEVNRQIITSVYEIQDAMDSLVAQKRRNVVSRFIQPSNVHNKVKDILERVTSVNEKFRQLSKEACISNTEQEERRRQSPQLNPDKEVVGFKEELAIVKNYLYEHSNELDVIPIIGMPGLGKTTLAYKIFTDYKNENPEVHCIWVHYRKNDVPLYILNTLTSGAYSTTHMSDRDISNLVLEQLGELGRFLIVIDDVPSPGVWEDISDGIFSRSQKQGKILITSQHVGIASCSKVTRKPLTLPLLTCKESWQLLQSEVFRREKYPSQLENPLENPGKEIAKKCNGLPLLIVMIGNYLKNIDSDMLSNQRRWEKVAASLCSSLDQEIQRNPNWFYYRLPYHLMQCFLYIGIFPEGFEIPVRLLMRLWIAEGFVEEKHGESLEETADEYLKELIHRNLLMIKEKGFVGNIKTCRVHNFLRVFCKYEASCERLNIFQEIKYMNKRFEPCISRLKEHRRLCIDSHIDDFISSSELSCQSAHSLACFGNDDIQTTDISYIPKVLKYLRVLEANNVITFKNLKKGWNKLDLLKCVVLSIDFKVIPKVISKLPNIETLIIHTTSEELEIKANIWKMRQLRHVETNKRTILPNPKKAREGKQLKTLGMISHQSCTEDVFRRLDSLRKLGIRGKLEAQHFQANGLGTLNELEKLKLENDSPANTPTSEEPLSQCNFPSYLRRLTLSATNLEWSHMSILGALVKLEVLKLKDNAFKGNFWGASDGSFPQLQLLKIITHNELITWEASDNSFPKLSYLMLSSCRGLQAIPSSLEKSLEKLYLEGHAKDSPIAASAKRIKERKNNLILEETVLEESGVASSGRNEENGQN